MSPIIAEKKQALDSLCRQFGVQTLEIFGSASTGTPPHGDLDFLVVFGPCDPVEHAQRYFGLLHGLEDLFDSKIDLLERRAVVNPYFLAKIHDSRKQLYAA